MNTTDWRTVPLWSVATETRVAVDPTDLGDQVVHYSIPAVDATGTGQVEATDSIKSAKLRLRGGEVLVSKLNPRKSRVLIVTDSLLPIVSSTEFVGLLPGAKLEPRFLAYFLQSEATRQVLDSQVQSVTRSHQRVAPEDITHLPVRLPSLDEQRRIADFLNAETTRIDKLTATLQRERDLLAERRAAGVAAAVSGSAHTNRRPSTLTWLESVPTAWQEVRLGLLARMGSGHTPSRSRPEWWTDCSIPWITTGEVRQVRDDRVEDLYETREKISELGLANSAAELHPRGTVFLCRTASAGYSGVMGIDMATSQDFVTWTCGPRLLPHYLLWCLRAMRPDLLGRLAMGSTHKTIYVPDLQMLRIPLPLPDEQEKITQTIRRQNARLDKLGDRVRLQQELLGERRQAIITAAVTGQFDVSTASGRNVTEGVSV
ncbi:restriction endonuclease subunit S [Streptomyces sp. SID5914]|nr:restriction endonuclease subunit S [Streptomyces sp. SID5914]MZG18049.1 restriction endonuclease subunit S [Streptomyces sp. SID5914]